MADIFNKARRAKKRGIVWDISKKDYESLRKITKCHYTGVTLEIAETSQQKSNTWTLDRIDNTLGYTMTNVVVCSRDANLIKNSLCGEGLKNFDPELINKVKSKIHFQKAVTIKSKWQRIWEILTS